MGHKLQEVNAKTAVAAEKRRPVEEKVDLDVLSDVRRLKADLALAWLVSRHVLGLRSHLDDFLAAAFLAAAFFGATFFAATFLAVAA